MKKIIMTVAVIIAAASAAKADVRQINFDGNSSVATGIGTAICENLEYAIPVPEAQPQQEEVFARLTEGMVNGVIQGAIEACATGGKETLKTDLGNLLKYGTLKEKSVFVYNKRGAYVLPAAIVARRFMPAGGDNPVQKLLALKSQSCFASHNERVCTPRQVCRIACAAAAGGIGSLGGGVAAGAAIGASGQICQELCEMVDECRNVTVCDQWVTDPGTGGLTDSHGNYRGRSVEFLN